MKKMWMWIVGAVVVLILGATAWALLTPSPNAGDTAKLEREFSAEEQARLDAVTVPRTELAAATCGEGAECWLAVDGVVYDVGGFDGWKDGRHHGIDAGGDQTEKFVGSGHAREVLQKMPVVGRLGE